MSSDRDLRGLRARERRTLWIAGAVLAFGLAIRLAVAGLGRTAELAASEELQRQLLARELALVESASMLRSRFSAAADSLLAAAPELIGGSSVREAGEHLASLFRSEASGTRVQVPEIRPLPPDSVGTSLRRVGLSATGECDLEGLLGLIWRLRSSTKLVHVTSLEIGVIETPVAPDEPERLSFTMELAGYWLADLDPDVSDSADAHAPGIADR